MSRITNQQLHEDLQDVKQDLRDIKIRLLDPDDGTIARTNKNTVFRKSTGKVLWSLWITVLGILGKIIFWD